MKVKHLVIGFLFILNIIGLYIDWTEPTIIVFICGFSYIVTGSIVSYATMYFWDTKLFK